MVPIRGEGHIQDAPAYIPGLDALEFMKAAIPAVIQSDCLVCASENQAELGNALLESCPGQASLFPWSWECALISIPKSGSGPF